MSVARTENEAKHNLHNALTSVSEWTRKWCIKLNSFKSTNVDFTNKSTLSIPIFIDGIQIPYANTEKCRHMTLDAILLWKEHVKIKIMELLLLIENVKLTNREKIQTVYRKKTGNILGPPSNVFFQQVLIS